VLKSLIREAKRNDLVVGGLELSPTYLSILAAKFAGRPFLPVVHNVLSRHIPHSPLAFIHFPLCKTVYRHSNQIIAVSRAVAEDLNRHFGIAKEKLRVIFNPVNIRQVQSMAAAEPDGVSNSSNYLVAVGRLDRQKGFDVLLKAFSKLDAKVRPDLIILGKGPEREKLEGLVKALQLERWVRLPGFTKNPYSVMSRARAFVFPSRYEGFGIALLEAMACGTPVVASQLPPVEEVCGKEGAVYFPPGDEEALARAITRVLTDEALRKRLINAGFKRIEEFDLARVGKKYAEIFNLLSSQRAKR